MPDSIVKAVQQTTVRFLDVRSEWEFEEDHIPNATNIPLELVPLKLTEIRDMPRPIVLYCRSGHRSGMALKMLKHAGVEDVYNGGGLQQVKQFV